MIVKLFKNRSPHVEVRAFVSFDKIKNLSTCIHSQLNKGKFMKKMIIITLSLFVAASSMSFAASCVKQSSGCTLNKLSYVEKAKAKRMMRMKDCNYKKADCGTCEKPCGVKKKKKCSKSGC